ncbi:MAG: putative membrane protein [Idiomarinaceae bacterium HL-53]|nr:MAG: putative membrane protein [Idiomarinaceae bacterium HL-53]
MNISSEKIKQLRTQRGWSQEQLSEMCGVNLRTIQRLEKRGTASQETLKALASVFDVATEALLAAKQPAPQRAFKSILNTLKDFDDFQSCSGRYEFWWFFLFFVLALALAETIHLVLASLVAIVLLVPFLAVSTRRLRDAGQSIWWQWMYIVPFGVLLVLYFLAMPSLRANDN